MKHHYRRNIKAFVWKRFDKCQCTDVLASLGYPVRSLGVGAGNVYVAVDSQIAIMKNYVEFNSGAKQLGPT